MELNVSKMSETPTSVYGILVLCLDTYRQLSAYIGEISVIWGEKDILKYSFKVNVFSNTLKDLSRDLVDI